LGYDKLTEEFHKPILDEWDKRWRLRQRGRFSQDEFEAWARYYYKTTCRIAFVIKLLMKDPKLSFIWWHAVERTANDAAEEIAKHLQFNKELRKIWDPKLTILPHPTKKKWFAAGQFRLKSKFLGPPTLRSYGAGSEATGGHADIGVLDDIIGLNDIMDNLMPKKRKWFGATVMNVISPEGFLLGTGTRWDYEDIYKDWLESPNWACRVRACYETDGTPDAQGKAVLFSRKVIKRKSSNMSSFEFDCQMMNDPTPSGERIWDVERCEHFVGVRDARHHGTVFVLSDPAPAKVGSTDSRDETRRADGSKDEWAIAVVKIQMNGQRQEIVLLDGSASRLWTKDEGFDECARLAKKWGTPLIANEATGQAVALYEEDLRKACRRMGSGFQPVKLGWTYLGKKNYVEALASKALRDEFLICETVPDSFKEGFLEQCRTVRFDVNGLAGIRALRGYLRSGRPIQGR
jgi:hypothetical protein